MKVINGIKVDYERNEATATIHSQNAGYWLTEMGYERATDYKYTGAGTVIMLYPSMEGAIQLVVYNEDITRAVDLARDVRALSEQVKVEA